MEVYYPTEQEKKRWAEATKGIMANYLKRNGNVGQALIEEVSKLR
jgi:TRAP-type C4-dicarboxylate transport system substrate-binding protein